MDQRSGAAHALDVAQLLDDLFLRHAAFCGHFINVYVTASRRLADVDRSKVLLAGKVLYLSQRSSCGPRHQCQSDEFRLGLERRLDRAAIHEWPIILAEHQYFAKSG